MGGLEDQQQMGIISDTHIPNIETMLCHYNSVWVPQWNCLSVPSNSIAVCCKYRDVNRCSI